MQKPLLVPDHCGFCGSADSIHITITTPFKSNEEER
jgi:hypothetical protein